MSAVYLNSDNFQNEVISSAMPVLVDFYADWCGPCKMLEPVMAELAKEYEGKVKIAKLDVDGAQDIAGQFGVMSIPTMILFKNGQRVEQAVGALPKEQIKQLIDKNI